MKKIARLLVLFCVLSCVANAGEKDAKALCYEAAFTADGWNMADWDMVQSWRFDYSGKWLQKATCIENAVPTDATPEEMQGKRCGETYTAMLLKQKIHGTVSFCSTMDFDYRMAPGLLITREPAVNKKGRLELREHYEIILYDHGINVWHHFFVNGKQQWNRHFYLLEPKHFQPKTPYTILCRVTKIAGGAYLEVTAGGRTVGGFLPAFWSDEYRIGIIGCEGVNRFYDFKVLPPATR